MPVSRRHFAPGQLPSRLRSVAVGTAVTRCPPHRPVRALLTHTVLTSDRGMFGIEAHIRIGCFPSFRAASRTRSSPLGPLSQLCVWHGLGCGVFSLASGLPSATSASGRPPLFGCFVGTMPLYDSPWPCMRDLPLIAFSLPARRTLPTGSHGVSRFSRMEFLRMPGVFDSAGPRTDSRLRPHPCGLPAALTGSTPGTS